MSHKNALFAVVLSLVSFAFAQRAQFDLCHLVIHVRADDGRDLGGHVQIQLLSHSGTPVSTAQTNDDGTAYFEVPSGVTYVVRITGAAVESSTSEIRIMGGQQSDTENIGVRRTASVATPRYSPTVSLSEINVPSKAREEMQKGMDAFDRGDLAKARQRFEKAISAYPRYARAYGNLGVVALRLGDRGGAREFFSKSIQVDDKYIPGYVHLARMECQDKNYNQAKLLLANVMSFDPSMPEVVALLATAEYGNKEYEKALADAQRLHALPGHEHFANIHLLAGQILEMQKRDQDAIAEYRAFLREAPDSPQVATVQKAVADLEGARH